MSRFNQVISSYLLKLVLFCAQSKEILQGWLRSGNTYTSNGTVEFLKQLQAGLGDQKIFFRADSGYFDGKILQWLEEQGHEYLVKVKLKGLTDFQDIAKQVIDHLCLGEAKIDNNVKV